MPSAIATVVIGDSYRRHYERVFRPSVQRYADRFGYELVLIDRHLCPPAWQHPTTISFTKLFIPGQPEMQAFERLMVLDADILVHSGAPPFTALELNDGVGIVDEWAQPSASERIAYQRYRGWESSANEYYALAGFRLVTEHVLNGGMFICSPARHGAFFADVSARHIAAQHNHSRGFHYEQSALGFELQQAGLARLLPAAWNRLWSPLRPRDAVSPEDRLRVFRRFADVYAESYCLHLTMGRDHDLAFLARNR